MHLVFTATIRENVERIAVFVFVCRHPAPLLHPHGATTPWFQLGSAVLVGQPVEVLCPLLAKGWIHIPDRPIRCPSCNLNLEQNDSERLATILSYSSGWYSPEKTSYNFCYLDLMSCSGTCPFPCRVLQIFLRICEIFYTCNNIDFFIVTRFDFTHLPPKKSLSNIHMYRNIQVLFEFTDDKITIEIF